MLTIPSTRVEEHHRDSGTTDSEGPDWQSFSRKFFDCNRLSGQNRNENVLALNLRPVGKRKREEEP